MARNPYVSLGSMPSERREYSENFRKFDGGLNIWDLDYQLNNNESSDTLNMLWENGVLSSRRGQAYVSENKNLGRGYACYERTFWSYSFFHIGTGIYCINFEEADEELLALCDDVTENKGIFIANGDYLLYKNNGTYKKIEYKPEKEIKFVCSDVEAYVPITYINTDPTTHAGDSYQPENRICDRKEIWYTPLPTRLATYSVTCAERTVNSITRNTLKLLNKHDAYEVEGVKDYNGNSLDLDLLNIEYVYEENGRMDNIFITSSDSNVLELKEGKIYTVTLKEYPLVYHLPVSDVGEVVSVKVDENECSVDSYTVDLSAGTVTFAEELAPINTFPAENNTVKIIYSKENPEAYKSIMECPYAISYGNGNGECIVVGGGPSQPNAYFWNGNHTVIDPGYFPMEQYNLAGDTEDNITGFGKQADLLIIFKNHSVIKTTINTTEIDGRAYITMNAATLNPNIGCDIPGSVRLIDNNLVFCNSEHGVCIIKSSSAANENNIMKISKKINGTNARAGLIEALIKVKDFCSCDDGKRYWLFADGKAWVWDYTLSDSNNPSWFYMEGINAVDFTFKAGEPYYLCADGCIAKSVQYANDFGQPIKKRYKFAVQNFGTYDRLKDVTGMMFVVRSDTDTIIDVLYSTDYGEKKERVSINGYSYRVFPRNLSFRYLGVKRFSGVAKRKPGARHVRHFAVTLENNEVNQDMSLVSAQILYKYSGKER